MSKTTGTQALGNHYFLKMDAIIIFIKNPQLGKVKTRLAATVGNTRALEIYQLLMHHTNAITRSLTAVDKYLYYSDFMDEKDVWGNTEYHKSVQISEKDLGLKMASAFLEIYEKKHTKAIIIGCDCLELNQDIIADAYRQLSINEVVIGPALDGGYYLIGFNFDLLGKHSEEVLKQMFWNKEWSHERVGQEAIETCQKMNLSYHLLPTLTDVDEEKDFLKTQHLLLKSD
jgi:rSAM/selenodomain-associated transferase 1